MARIADAWRMQMLVESASRTALQRSHYDVAYCQFSLRNIEALLRPAEPPAPSVAVLPPVWVAPGPRQALVAETAAGLGAGAQQCGGPGGAGHLRIDPG